MIVEGMIESMMKDYRQVIADNQHLHEELHHSNEVARSNFDLVTALESELEKLKADGIGACISGQNNDCQIELAKLQHQLAERDKIIEDLLQKMGNSDVHASNEPNEKGKSDDPMNLFDASQKLKQTITDLEKISDEIECILNEKQNKIQEQQAQIDELTKQLELRNQEVSNANEEECMKKLKEMKEQNQILAQQAAMQEEQNAVLIDERNKLIETNNELKKSIIVVQKEICEYNFE